MIQDIKIKGTVSRITYMNQENGYHVLRFQSDENSKQITVTGVFPPLIVGERLILLGYWQNHPKYGKQFQVNSFQPLIPHSEQDIEKYLGSGLIKGIGSSTAKKIVAQFGKEALNIIDKNPERLTEVEGIGSKKIKTIKEGWDQQKEISSILVFLKAHDISSHFAIKIFNKYGQEAIKILKSNPYRLIEDLEGVGFKTADNLAFKMGVAPNSTLRIKAALIHTLQNGADNGHVFLPQNVLVKEAINILEVTEDILLAQLQQLINEKKVIAPLNENGDSQAIYLPFLYFCEEETAKMIINRLTYQKKDPPQEDVINKTLTAEDLILAQEQKQALEKSLQKNFLIITGGPGTGKTTTVRIIINAYRLQNKKIILAAPTGRAAKRLEETTGIKAKTIHRLLEFSPQNNKFQRDQVNPLDADLIIIDEISMVDTVLIYHTLKAIRSLTTVILVGDANQLPSVGAGNVLAELLKNQQIERIYLKTIFRQAQKSSIIVNSHRINQGQRPVLKNSKELDDFYFIKQEEPEKALQTILFLAQKRIPQRFNFNPLKDIQVLSPMHKGLVGAENLNRLLQQKLNPAQKAFNFGPNMFQLGDKVMQIKNNYEKDVFNGDLGFIKDIDSENQSMIVEFEERFLRYEREDLSQLIPAYAISIHKSQGSEYPCVIIPLLTQHYIMLQRNLLYTAVSRGKKLVVIVGSMKALYISIKNDSIKERYTNLAAKISRYLPFT